MEIQEELHKFGLHKSEIKIYLYLLQQGLATPPQIASGTGLARTNCYNLLRSLKEKKLITENLRGKRKAYAVNDPGTLALLLEERQESLQKILPDLQAMHLKQIHKPRITFFEGLEEVKEIYLRTLSAPEVFAIGSMKKLAESLPDFFLKYQKEIRKRNIIFHDLLTHPSGEVEVPKVKAFLRGLYEVKFLPAEYGDMPNDILVWSDNIALITLEEPIFGTVLTNQQLADMFRMIFRVLWEKIEA